MFGALAALLLCIFASSGLSFGLVTRTRGPLQRLRRGASSDRGILVTDGTVIAAAEGSGGIGAAEGELESCELSSEGLAEDCHKRKVSASGGSAYQPLAPSVWTVFGGLASATNACNLGQGFPDWAPPQFMLDSLRDAIDSPFHQYTRPAGHPQLVELLGERYSKHMGREIDPYREVTVTVGASQALFLTLTTLLEPGDEVAMFDPYFDLYLKQLKAIAPKSVPKFITLGSAVGEEANSRATETDPWAVDVKSLERAITDKTKILLLNSPHNPTGKVFSLEELKAIAEVVEKYPNLVVVSDEVYKFSIYDAAEAGDSTARGHYHFARLPGMWDRTVTLSSAGKTFSATGWQIGWIVGPERYTRPIHDLIPCVQFCANTPAQHAFCNALTVANEPTRARRTSIPGCACGSCQAPEAGKGPEGGGMTPVPSQGGCFLMARLPNSHALVERTAMSPMIGGSAVCLRTSMALLAFQRLPSLLRSGKVLGRMERRLGTPDSPSVRGQNNRRGCEAAGG